MVSLIHGDCLEKMQDIPDGSVDMVLTDPPYGTTACKWDSIIPLKSMWAQLKRVIKPNGAIVMTASQPFTTTLISSNMKWFKYCWVWEKEIGTNFLSAKYMPLKNHEDVIVFSPKSPTYNPIMTEGEPYVCFSGTHKGVYGNPNSVLTDNSGERYPKTVQKFKREVGQHPTQKPTALMRYMIETYTNRGETVLDFTMGSGTTGVACRQTGRDFIGIEIDAGYFKIAEDRINGVLC